MVPVMMRALVVLVVSECLLHPAGAANCSWDTSVDAAGITATIAGASFVPDVAGSRFFATRCTRTGYVCADAACDVAPTCATNFHVASNLCVPCELGTTRTAGDPTGGPNTACSATGNAGETGCPAGYVQTSGDAAGNQTHCSMCSNGGTTAGTTAFGAPGSYGSCTSTAGYIYPAGAAAATGCAADFSVSNSTGSWACAACAIGLARPSASLFSAGDKACTTCAPGYVQTAGNSTAGNCTACSNAGTKPAAIWAAAGTDNAGWGACASATGYIYAAGVAAATGCAAGFIQTAAAGTDAAGECTACTHSGTKVAADFAACLTGGGAPWPVTPSRPPARAPLATRRRAAPPTTSRLPALPKQVTPPTSAAPATLQPQLLQQSLPRGSPPRAPPALAGACA